MLKYPREYELHWMLWTSGTTRILLWGDPEYLKRFAGTVHLGGVQGYDVWSRWPPRWPGNRSR